MSTTRQNPRVDNEGPTRPHPRRRLLVIAAVGALAVAAMGATWFLLAGRATVVDVNEAVRGYRSRSRAAAPVASPTPVSDVGVGTSSITVLPTLAPSPGVYRYVTTGREHAGLPGSTRQFPTETPMTVVADGANCREDSRLVFREHTSAMTLCAPAPGRIDLVRVSARVDFLGGGFEFAASCPALSLVAPDAVPTRRTVRCEAGVRLTVEAAGDEEVAVEDVSIPAARVRLVIEPAGDLHGKISRDVWFSRGNGIVLKEVSETRVSTPSRVPLFRSSYREVATFRLLSLRPER